MTATNSIEIVTHCWAGDLKLYSNFLNLQGLSLATRTDFDGKITWTVCYHPEDEATFAVIRNVRVSATNPNFKVNEILLQKDQLFQRACGRNIAALNSKASTVWFCDSDYVFYGDVLNQACQAAKRSPLAINFPRRLLATEKWFGDALQRMTALRYPTLRIIDECQKGFKHFKLDRAIGGAQIVHGSLARARGYLDGTKWVEPVRDTESGFLTTRCDIAYRRYIGGGRGIKCDVDAMRIRHTDRILKGELMSDDSEPPEWTGTHDRGMVAS